MKGEEKKEKKEKWRGNLVEGGDVMLEVNQSEGSNT